MRCRLLYWTRCRYNQINFFVHLSQATNMKYFLDYFWMAEANVMISTVFCLHYCNLLQSWMINAHWVQAISVLEHIAELLRRALRYYDGRLSNRFPDKKYIGTFCFWRDLHRFAFAATWLGTLILPNSIRIAICSDVKLVSIWARLPLKGP